MSHVIPLFSAVAALLVRQKNEGSGNMLQRMPPSDKLEVVRQAQATVSQHLTERGLSKSVLNFLNASNIVDLHVLQ